MRGTRLVALLALAGLVLVAGCGDGDDPGTAGTPAESRSAAAPSASPGERIEVAGRTAIYHGTKDISGATEVTIDLADGYFTPTVLKGEPRQKVQLTLRNRGETPHHFTTADQQLIVEVQPGLSAEGRVTLPSSGNLSFYCLLHHQDGMAGGFNVSGDVAAAGPEATPTGGSTDQPGGPEATPTGGSTDQPGGPEATPTR